MARLEKAEEESSEAVIEDGIRFCGNINAVGWNEVFKLAPGETKQLEIWSYIPPFREAGTYKALPFLRESSVAGMARCADGHS
jgi:hypothetical protein